MSIWLTILFAVLAAARLISELLFLQQNSYQNRAYLRWAARNPRRYLSPLSIGTVLAAAASFWLTDWFLFPTAAAIWLALEAVWLLRAKQKKRLVFTPRVLRLCAVLTVLLAASCIPGMWQIPLAAAALSPFAVALGNIIIRPVELLINRWFISDAKRVIGGLPDLTVIGVTGSYGKTSVKFMLEKLLSVRYNVLVTPESFNTTMGVVKTVRGMLKPYHEIFVCEMGAKRTGEIREICNIVRPTHGIITSIGPQHLETFGSLEAVIQTKFELCEALPADGIRFLNWDNEHVRSNTTDRRLVRFGTDDGSVNADYTAAEICYTGRGSEFMLYHGEERVPFRTALLGSHNILDITAAISVAHTLGIPFSALQGAVEELRPVRHRMEILPRGNGVTVIDDAFNSNPIGAKAALDVLAQMDCKKRIVITPGMIELGELEEPLNRDFGAQMASSCDYAVLVGAKRSAPIKEGLMEQNFPEEQIFVANNLQDAIAFANSKAEPGTAILFENDLPDLYNE